MILTPASLVTHHEWPCTQFFLQISFKIFSISFTNCSNLHFHFGKFYISLKKQTDEQKKLLSQWHKMFASLWQHRQRVSNGKHAIDCRNAWNLFLYRLQFLVFLVISIFSSLRRLFCLKVKILARNGRINQQFSIPRAYKTLCYANRKFLSFGFLINQQTTETRRPTPDVEALH